MTELEENKFGEGIAGTAVAAQLMGQRGRHHEFHRYLKLVRPLAPEGLWLDVGCGTGELLLAAAAGGIEMDGLELTPDRRALAEQRTGRLVHGAPLEEAKIPPSSLAVVTMINVFSHLIAPSQTFRRVRELLMPGGVLLMRTSEIGEGAAKRHSPDWSLGDHVHFLGANTIEQYADAVGLELVERQSVWQPAATFSRDRLSSMTPSFKKNAIKRILRLPVVYPLARAAYFRVNHDSPMHDSVLVLRKH